MESLLKQGRLSYVNLKDFVYNGAIPFGNFHFFAKHFAPYSFIRNICRGKTILEIGFGEGYGLYYLSGVAKQYIGIDRSLRRYGQGDKKYHLKNLLMMDGANLGFKENSFDIVYCCQVIEHIPQPRVLAFLREAKRALKDDGLFICSTLNLENNIKGARQDYEKFHEHEKEYTHGELSRLLRQVFSDVRIYGLFRTFRHNFFLRLKKWGLLRANFFSLNPVKRFYNNISTSDFKILRSNLAKCIDFIAVCRN